MKYNGDKVEGIKIAYIGGGSRGWAWRLMSDLALEQSLSGTVYLYDIDYEAAKTNEIIGNNLKSQWEYKSVDSMEEALKGADFVIISILPGTFNEMMSDVHTPEKFGIYQSVGDTTGPGGLFRALRTIPLYVEFANKIKKYCPEAWVINYTNPMALCVKTLYETFPKIKAFGCCHEVFSTQNLIAKAAKEIEGIECSREDIRTNVLGINHFTWIDKATYKNIDLIPVYKKFVEKYFESGYEDRGDWKESYFNSANKVKFDLFNKYGIIAAAGDRHLAEFIPFFGYLENPEAVAKWKFHLTPVSWRIKNREELIKKSKKMAKGEEKFEIEPSGEEGVKQMKALLGLGDLITNVNLPNRGQMEGVEFNTVVETNAFFTKDRVQPIISGKLPDTVNMLLSPHVLNQKMIFEAAIKKDKELVFHAFLNDPFVRKLTYSDAKKLFNEMFDNAREYLKGW
ncbi:glycoside hydrolase family 4 [Thermoanaerobacter italicus Ab9]|uniref:Alpha-galacturonidase n=1 Tax=Thermoanaerobacter italicus (strain DSM 9252 / Ab9) TaxID=580331 RepID=LPLD_THEIA|nr:alpha-galacturonidase [Thermoanaerobacter italicus]D3T426.1 RecName: Full=Alpha-galacturonidase [Thermoanaerobacter italicus Ab9]ADD02978.1 glycoside hydrolase family 4 [Thermoanaerobacter italicus Ab9]